MLQVPVFGDFRENIKLFRPFRASGIDISRPDPMFRFDAARIRNANS